MPYKRRISVKDISSVAASKTVVINIPTGPRCHGLILQHGYAAGTNTAVAAAANITDIRIKVNGRIQRTHSGTQLRDMNNLMGTQTSALQYDFTGVPNTAPGVTIPIFFAEPWRRDVKDSDALAWWTNQFESFQIEVDLGAASTPTLVCWAIVDDPIAFPKELQPISKVYRLNVNAAGTAYDITTLDKRDYLTQMTIYPDSGGSNQPSRVYLRKDSVILHELTVSANLALNQNMGGMMPVLSTVRTANVYDLVFDTDDLLGSAPLLQGARDLVLTIESASAMSGTQTLILSKVGLPD